MVIFDLKAIIKSNQTNIHTKRGDYMSAKRLYRSRKEKVLAGVGGGLAEYFKIDPTIVRIIMVLVAFSASEFFIVGYIIAAIVIPERPKDHVYDDEEPEVLDENGETINRFSDKRQVIGLLFVGAGALMLVNRFVSWMDSGVILAVAVIGVGIYVLVQRESKEDA